MKCKVRGAEAAYTGAELKCRLNKAQIRTSRFSKQWSKMRETCSAKMKELRREIVMLTGDKKSGGRSKFLGIECSTY